MFDYQRSKHPHFETDCRAFAQAHNRAEVANAVGMHPWWQRLLKVIGGRYGR